MFVTVQLFGPGLSCPRRGQVQNVGLSELTVDSADTEHFHKVGSSESLMIAARVSALVSVLTAKEGGERGRSLLCDIRQRNSRPCGYSGDLKLECRCSPLQVPRYRQRISGTPLEKASDIYAR